MIAVDPEVQSTPQRMTLSEVLRHIRTITLRPGCTQVERTVARGMLRDCSPRAVIQERGKNPSLSIALIPAGVPSYSLGVDATENITLSASHGALLFAAATLAAEDWANRPADEFLQPVRHETAFRWLRNYSDFLVGSLRYGRRFNREKYLGQIARQGFTHVTVNGLGVEQPFESSPPGDVYHWFYDYSPDLDQFVDSALLRGYYPPDYLSANLKLLKDTAALARRYGLTPGLHINSPRSMPEQFWRRHGFLRGARVDHPRETLRPRYSLAMAHPAVQQHYRELIRRILDEVPEIGFIHLWTNDSGSGFEFVSTLYAGRNGGPYLIREWKNHQEIARKAGENVLTYFHLLRDEAMRVNPQFRLICDLGPFMDERQTVIAGMGNGIDAGDFAYFEGAATDAERQLLVSVGAETHVKLDLSENNVLGVPFPRLVHERMASLRRQGGAYLLTGGTPATLAPFDINREVVRAFQLTPERQVEEILNFWAAEWSGREQASTLLAIWDLADEAVRNFPPGVPMSTFGFPWFRLWVRPFVPNIDMIPEKERRYYERYLLATYNNPARIDLNNDMMWNFLSVSEAGEKKQIVDEKVLGPLDCAIDKCSMALGTAAAREGKVFQDLLDRLRAARCYYTTMRNMLAWIESVHGYCQASNPQERESYRELCCEMVNDELDNARDLLGLWETSTVEFMPVSTIGETLHIHSKNFGALLRKKIHLMECFGDEEPAVDPKYMWRMPGQRRMKNGEYRMKNVKEGKRRL
jgi:hypothetical protein